MAVSTYWGAARLVKHFRSVGKRGLVRSVLTDELVGAVVERALEAAQGDYIELNESLTLHYDESLAVDFRAGGPRLEGRRLRINVDGVSFHRNKYSINRHFIRIIEKYFQVFYNTDHAVLIRLTDDALFKLLDTEKIPAPPLRPRWSAENRSKVEVTLGLEREVGERIAAHAASIGLDVEEWIQDAITRRLRGLPEPVINALPTTPPEHYENRPDKTETAPAFIKRVYHDWLTGDFTRADLRKLDAKAEMALRNWERKNGRAELNLPTLKERNDQLIADGRLLTTDPKETSRRFAAAAYRHSHAPSPNTK